METSKVRVYDIESLYDFFCITTVDRYSDETHHFRIWREVNQTLEFCDFLDNFCQGLIGFNNINYDWPICQYIRVARKKLSTVSGQEAAMIIYAKSQEILSQKYSAIRNPSIPQLDLYRLHHFDNKNKAVSLKALQIAMNWPLVADMPVHHGDYAEGEEWANSVVEYNLNDVLSTKFFLEKSEKDIELRKKVGEIYHLDLLNHNEPKMGEDIVITQIAKNMEVPAHILRETNTKRDSVAIANCMLPITFETHEFSKAFSIFKNLVIDTHVKSDEEKKKDKEDKEDLYSCIFDRVRYDFGLGGLHGLQKPGIYQENDDFLILSVDVSSYYPHLAIQNGFRPEHLGDSFGTIYKGMYRERKKFPKGSLEDKGLKISLVSVFGKSKDQWSPLYDPKYFYQIVVNGQLLLAKLAEMLTLEGKCHVIMANTDGLELYVPRGNEGLVDSILRNWELETGLILESKQYRRLFIRDVNNYVGEKIDSPGQNSYSTYVKGAFEHENIAWHKDHSMLAVPYAAEKFLVKGQSIQKSFDECSVEKFFIGKRAKSGGEFLLRSLEDSEDNGSFVREAKLHKTVRYLISKRGAYLFKKGDTGKMTRIDSPWKVLNCMNVRGIDLETLRPLIDYRYYEAEVKSLLRPILNTQSTFL